MDLIEFLRARLDEDEAVARSANADEARTPYGDRNLAPLPPEQWGDLVENYLGGPIGRHCAAWSAARVLAEVEAKRAIIDRLAAYQPGWSGYREFLTCVMHLAQPYAQRADFDPAWLMKPVYR